MHAERIYMGLYKGPGIDPKTFGRSLHCVYIQVPAPVGMDVPFVVAQHDQLFSTILALLVLHQMEPKPITVS
jgi:hypothetical protein